MIDDLETKRLAMSWKHYYNKMMEAVGNEDDEDYQGISTLECHEILTYISDVLMYKKGLTAIEVYKITKGDM